MMTYSDTCPPCGTKFSGEDREALELLEERSSDQLGHQRYRTLLRGLTAIQAIAHPVST